MINWFWQISHKFDTKLFFGDCDNTAVHNIFGSLLDFEMTTVPHLHYWRMINLQKSLVDSISNFCSAQQWSCSSFAFMCIVSPSISWGLTKRLQRMEHRSLVLFNHRHQKGSHLIPCKGFVDQNKQEAGGNVFSEGENSMYISSCWLK